MLLSGFCQIIKGCQVVGQTIGIWRILLDSLPHQDGQNAIALLIDSMLSKKDLAIHKRKNWERLKKKHIF